MSDLSEDDVNDAFIILLNGIWAADEYNSICNENPIKLPITEDQLKNDLVESTESDIADEIATTMFVGDMNLKEHAKSIIRGYVDGDCSSELAIRKRAKIVGALTNYQIIYDDG
jgi:hypothetical protein